MLDVYLPIYVYYDIPWYDILTYYAYKSYKYKKNKWSLYKHSYIHMMDDISCILIQILSLDVFVTLCMQNYKISVGLHPRHPRSTESKELPKLRFCRIIMKKPAKRPRFAVPPQLFVTFLQVTASVAKHWRAPWRSVGFGFDNWTMLKYMKYTRQNWHGTGKSPLLVGDTSSNDCFPCSC